MTNKDFLMLMSVSEFFIKERTLAHTWQGMLAKSILF